MGTKLSLSKKGVVMIFKIWAVSLCLFMIPLHSFAAVEKAILAGGCFWCMEVPYEKLPGVQSVESGYTGGNKLNPTYKEVSSGNSGHTESVEITFDNKVITYEKLLDIFWKNIDPLDESGQFCDKGEQYKSGIFFLSETQKNEAEKSLKKVQALQKFKKEKIATFIRPASVFYKAEDYHQDYYKKNPIRYKYYRFSCGRDKRLKELWD